MSTINEVIPGLGTPPLTTNPTGFDANADQLYGVDLPAVIASMNTFKDEANVVAGEVNTNASNAATSAGNSSDFADLSEAAKVAAQNAANATLWVSGGPFVAGDVRYAPSNYKSYRCKISNSGTTDPSLDITNWQDLSSSFVVQVVNTQTGALASGTTILPLDNTIPQNTEGDQYMSLSITPTRATNKLLIEVVVMGGFAAGRRLVAALFQDSTAGALAAMANSAADSGILPNCLFFSHTMTTGTTSATTFKVRVGPDTAGTFYFNGEGNTAGRVFGGVAASSITITEYET